MAETRADLPRVEILGGMRLALNVRMQGIRPELLLGPMVASGLCIERGVKLVVTAILNGPHMKNSLHYSGAAVDFTIDQVVGRKRFVVTLRERLGNSYDVIDESTHIHIEYQPHHGAVT